jgi:hypothetical protein
MVDHEPPQTGPDLDDGRKRDGALLEGVVPPRGSDSELLFVFALGLQVLVIPEFW